MDEPCPAPPVDHLPGPPLAQWPVPAEEPADHVGPDGELLTDPAQDGEIPFGDQHALGPILDLLRPRLAISRSRFVVIPQRRNSRHRHLFFSFLSRERRRPPFFCLLNP